MANYLDLMNQMQDRRRAGLAEYSPTNPYGSSSYIYQDAQDIYNQSEGEALQEPFAEGYIPSELYTPPTVEEKIARGVSNISTSQTLSTVAQKTLPKIGQKYLGGVSQTMANPAVGAPGHVAGTAVGAPVANTAAGAAGPIAGMGTAGYGAIGAIAYTAANDNNPYTYGQGEAIGMGLGDAATATALSTAAGVYAPWIPIATAALGYLFRKRRAKRMKQREQEVLVANEESVQNKYTQNLIKERRKRELYKSQTYRNTGN